MTTLTPNDYHFVHECSVLGKDHTTWKPLIME